MFSSRRLSLSCDDDGDNKDEGKVDYDVELFLFLLSNTHCEILEKQVTPVVLDIEEQPKDENKKHSADKDKDRISFERETYR